MEGEVFIALGTSHGDFEPPRASISPQSPPSLKPAILKYWTSPFPIKGVSGVFFTFFFFFIEIPVCKQSRSDVAFCGI